MVTLCINIFISNWKRDCHNYYQLKKIHNQKLRATFYLVGIFRTSSLGDSISSKPERTALRRWAEEPDCIEALQQSAGSRNNKRLLLIKKDGYLKLRTDFPGGSDSQESACNVGDLGLIPGLRRSPGEGNGYPLQYSCLENPMDRGTWKATVHGVAKSQTWLSD